MTDPRPPEVERSDVQPRALGLIALSLAGVVAGVMALLPALFPEAMRQPAAVSAPPPGLGAELAGLRAAEDRQLTDYGWVDRERGLVRVPIGEAMARLLARGIPDWPGGGAGP